MNEQNVVSKSALWVARDFPQTTLSRSWHGTPDAIPRRRGRNGDPWWSEHPPGWKRLSIWPAEVELHHGSLTHSPWNSHDGWKTYVFPFLVWQIIRAYVKTSQKVHLRVVQVKTVEIWTELNHYSTDLSQSNLTHYFGFHQALNGTLPTDPELICWSYLILRFMGPFHGFFPLVGKKTIICLPKHQLVGANIYTFILNLILSCSCLTQELKTYNI